MKQLRNRWPFYRAGGICLLFLLAMVLQGQGVHAQGAKGIPPALSGKVLNQLNILGAEKRARTPAQRKMSSRLVHTIKQRRHDPQMRGLARLRSNVEVAPDETILVDIRAEVTLRLLEEIRFLGGTVVNAYAEYDAIRARLPLGSLETLAAGRDVHFIRPASRAFLNKTNTSEGDAAHGARTARTTFGVTGRGIKVGVLSDSVDHLAGVKASGDLPPRVTVLSDAPGNSGEGTAMLEIIHDLAPESDLYFATAWKGKASFASNIKALANAGCRVIVDDVSYVDESPFQDDIIAQAVNSVTSGGVLYFSAAGNAGNLNDGTAGVWEGDFNGQLLQIGSDPAEVQNFGGGDWANRITADGECYTLFWSDPLGGSGNDYDLYLVDPALTTIVAESSSYQTGTEDPIEGFCIADDLTNYHLMVRKFSGQDRFIHLSAGRGRLEHRTAGQISGHAAAEDAFAIAAVSARGRTIPFAGAERVESFTSDGPRRIFYHADGTPVTPGNFSATGGMVRNKPDFAAADGVVTATPGLFRFYGTSAAAPHAAAIGALMLAKKSFLQVNQVRQALKRSAFDIEKRGWDRDSGYGLIMADRALEAVKEYGRFDPGMLYLQLLR